MGVFIYHLSLCAKALGHKFSYSVQLPPVDSLKGSGVVQFAACQIEFSGQPGDQTLLDTLAFRQTSRKKYFEGVDESLSAEMIKIASKKASDTGSNEPSGYPPGYLAQPKSRI